MQDLISLSPESVLAGLRAVSAHASTHLDSNRRIDSREMLVEPVEIQPLTEDMSFSGGPILGTTRNVSLGGVGFSTMESFDEPYALLSFTDVKTEGVNRFLVRVHHRRYVGPLFEIGGQFCVDWDHD